MARDKLSAYIAEKLFYYTNNPKKRCTDGEGRCFYSGKSVGKKTKGCLIGSMFTPAQRVILDAKYKLKSLREITKQSKFTPNFIVNNLELMEYLQSFHDDSSNFTDKGLSYEGKYELESIIEEFELSRKYFMTILIS